MDATLKLLCGSLALRRYQLARQPRHDLMRGYALVGAQALTQIVSITLEHYATARTREEVGREIRENLNLLRAEGAPVVPGIRLSTLNPQPA